MGAVAGAGFVTDSLASVSSVAVSSEFRLVTLGGCFGLIACWAGRERDDLAAGTGASAGGGVGVTETSLPPRLVARLVPRPESVSSIGGVSSGTSTGAAGCAFFFDAALRDAFPRAGSGTGVGVTVGVGVGVSRTSASTSISSVASTTTFRFFAGLRSRSLSLSFSRPFSRCLALFDTATIKCSRLRGGGRRVRPELRVAWGSGATVSTSTGVGRGGRSRRGRDGW